jgi:hypothetical protein
MATDTLIPREPHEFWYAARKRHRVLSAEADR